MTLSSMSSGWDLKFGELNDNADANLFSVVAKALLSKQYKTTTYKFCFFKSILNCTYYTNERCEIAISDLSKEFSSTYWDLINVNKIPQKPESLADNGSSVEILVRKYTEQYPETNSIYFENIKSHIQNSFLKECEKIVVKYVVGALYSETKGLLYGFSKKEKKIVLNQRSLDFLRDNKVILEQLCYYEWLKMCESILEKQQRHIPNISIIIEDVNKRRNLDSYKEALTALLDSPVCFYCGKTHKNRRLTLDHVIPWRFLKTDDLWNLVWCCLKCNSSKNDKLPSREFIDKLIKRNNSLKIQQPDILKISTIALSNGVDEWRIHK